nr:hypothetical protein [Chloroflexota bacterium]
MTRFHKKTMAILATVMVLVMLLTVSASPVLAATYSGGSGTEGDPYQISTAADWTTLRNTSGDWGKYFILTADIDFGEAALTPVGGSTQFTGSFDGDGHALSNATINSGAGMESCYVGVFGRVSSAGLIRDLRAEDIDVTGSRRVGGLVGENNGTIINCGATGDVTGLSFEDEMMGTMGPGYIGGLVGISESGGSVTGSYATGDVTTPTISSGGGRYVGGLVGSNYSGSGITDSYATGAVAGYSEVGGLVGWNRTALTRGYATGAVTGSSDVGGLVGDNIATVTASSWDTQTTGQRSRDRGTRLTTAAMTHPSPGRAAPCWHFG